MEIEELWEIEAPKVLYLKINFLKRPLEMAVLKVYYTKYKPESSIENINTKGLLLKMKDLEVFYLNVFYSK